MENIDATYPMELVHMNYLMIEATEGCKDAHILVITDHFAKYVQAIVSSSQTENIQPKTYGTNSLSIMGS